MKDLIYDPNTSYSCNGPYDCEDRLGTRGKWSLIDEHYEHLYFCTF